MNSYRIANEVLRILQDQSGLVGTIRVYSGLFRTAPQYTGPFRIIQVYSGLFRTIYGITRDYSGLTDMFTWLWGPQSRSSWRGEWLKCLHVHGTFKFQVRFRVEGH